MNIDSDISNMIFLASIACLLIGKTDWAMYLVLSALYVSMIEHGINPLSVKFHSQQK